MFNVAVGTATGFAPYSLLDPVIVGDVATLKSYILHLPRPTIPTLPGLTGIVSPNAADPTLSLVASPLTPDPSPPSTGASGVSIVVVLDDPHPTGSTGLTEAVLALKYDPSILSIAPEDITLGSIPGQAGWQMNVQIDQANGWIGIELYSTRPLTTDVAGSRVNLSFHSVPGASSSIAAVQLVDSVRIGQQFFGTLLADDQGGWVLSPGVDQVLVGIQGS